VINLKVCLKCWSETQNITDNCYWYNDTRVECPLSRLDEEARTVLSGAWVLLAGPPPRWCPKKFEHAVSEGMNSVGHD
jgi:hypothetical protein